MAFNYIHDPQEIENQSFRIIRELTDISGLSEAEQQVVMRLVHTCGEPEVRNDIHFSANACTAGLAALKNNVPVLCDVEMVRHGIARRFIGGEIFCHLLAAGVAERAKATSETRSMAALEEWRPHLSGSIVVIGNAPTALFRLLEMVQAGAEKPALVIGMPVGFVGAAESKEALMQHAAHLGLEYICVSGRRGGSALAAAAINALARINHGVTF